MNVVSQVFAVMAGVVHVGIFVLESLLLGRPAVRQRFLGRAELSPDVLVWAFNQGFYNLFLAAGAIGGVLFVHSGQMATGRAVALFACACMVAAGGVLLTSDRRLWRGALGQALPPLVALLAAWQ
jgi:putative membrane protein